MEELQIKVELLRKHSLKIHDNPDFSSYNSSSEKCADCKGLKCLKKSQKSNKVVGRVKFPHHYSLVINGTRSLLYRHVFSMSLFSKSLLKI